LPALQLLANGENFIYIASRVFDFAEKIKAEDMEKAVINGITRAMREVGISPQENAPLTFVPFRDTVQKKAGNQSSVQTHTHELTQRIYREDIERLNKLFALVGFFDGLSKDEGVCMELGYAFGLNKPIILGMTDFVRADYKGILNSEHFADPVIEAMASKIIYEYQIDETEDTFRQQLQASLRKLFTKVEEEIYLLGIESAREGQNPQQGDSEVSLVKHDVYVDFGGGLFEWQRTLQEQLANKLNNVGWRCAVSNRYSYHTQFTDRITIKQLGWQDIQKAESSKVVITCSDSIEMNSGTAAIQGFSRAVGKKVVLYDSKITNIVADNHYKSSRNLMIDYSSDKTVSRFDEIPNAVKELLID